MFMMKKTLMMISTTMMTNKTMDGFEKREQVAKFGYWKDPRWKQVKKLRKENKIPESNRLVMEIRSDFDLD